jgi:hypothetical protein
MTIHLAFPVVDPPLGLCPDCERWYRVSTLGQMWRHNVAGPAPRPVCPGVGAPAKEITHGAIPRPE